MNAFVYDHETDCRHRQELADEYPGHDALIRRLSPALIDSLWIDHATGDDLTDRMANLS